MDDTTKDEVVRLYKAGVKTHEITDQTGVPRPTIYWILNERGVRPSRTKAKAAEGIDVAQVLAQLAAAEREVGRLEAELQAEKALNTALLDRLAGVEGVSRTSP
jgi:orotate phosphoribosyltransferase-like protein